MYQKPTTCGRLSKDPPSDMKQHHRTTSSPWDLGGRLGPLASHLPGLAPQMQQRLTVASPMLPAAVLGRSSTSAHQNKSLEKPEVQASLSALKGEGFLEGRDGDACLT